MSEPSAKLHDVEQRIEPAGREHSRHLVHQRRLVFDVHADVEHGRDVECAVAKRQIESGRHLEPRFEPHISRQPSRDIHVVRREVDTRHLGTVGLHEIAGRAAHAAANVEHTGRRADLQLVEQVFRRLQSAGVKLVDRFEVGGHELLAVPATIFDRRENALQEVIRCVVRFDPLLYLAHLSLPIARASACQRIKVRRAAVPSSLSGSPCPAPDDDVLLRERLGHDLSIEPAGLELLHHLLCVKTMGRRRSV